MRLLVTGGSGFIGSHLVERLLSRGHEISVLDDFSRGRRIYGESKEIRVFSGDVRDSQFVSKVLSHGFETVFHLAAVNGTENFYIKSREVFDIGVKGTLNIIEASSFFGVKDLIVASSAEVYANPALIPTPEDVNINISFPLSPRFSYGGSKLVSELMMHYLARDLFERAIVFRPHNIYGPNMGYEHVIPQIAIKALSAKRQNTNEISIQGTGLETRAFCYIEDLLSGLELILKRGENGHTYNIGNPSETSIEQLTRIISKHFNLDASVLASKPLENSPVRRCPDITKMQNLGYEPAISILAGVSRTLEWYESNSEFRERALKL